MREVSRLCDVFENFETGFLSIVDSSDIDGSTISAIPLLTIKLTSPEPAFRAVEPLMETCITPPGFTSSGKEKPIELNAPLKADKLTVSRVILGPCSSVVVTMPTPARVPATSANSTLAPATAFLVDKVYGTLFQWHRFRLLSRLEFFGTDSTPAAEWKTYAWKASRYSE